MVYSNFFGKRDIGIPLFRTAFDMRKISRKKAIYNESQVCTNKMISFEN